MTFPKLCFVSKSTCHYCCRRDLRTPRWIIESERYLSKLITVQENSFSHCSKQTSKLFVCNEGELNGIDPIKRYLILFKVSLNFLVDAFAKILVLSWCLHCTPWYLEYYGIKYSLKLHEFCIPWYWMITMLFPLQKMLTFTQRYWKSCTI